jgi:hypothetical protein
MSSILLEFLLRNLFFWDICLFFWLGTSLLQLSLFSVVYTWCFNLIWEGSLLIISVLCILYLDVHLFLKIWDISAIILLNIFSMPIPYISFLSVAMIHQFGLSILSKSSCVILSYFFSLLLPAYCYSLTFSSNPDVLSSTWPILFVRLSTEFWSKILSFSIPKFQFYFFRISMPLFYSFFIFCIGFPMSLNCIYYLLGGYGVVLEAEHRASGLLGRCSIIWISLPVLLL